MNLVILTAIRSGSTLLCNMLNATRYFRYPQLLSTHPSLERQKKAFEIMAPNKHLDIEDKKAYFEAKTISLRKQLIYKHEYMPAMLKIPKEHYCYYDSPKRSFIEECIPNVKFVWLERKDFLARVMSAYFFFYSKIPHIESKELHTKYASMRIPFNLEGILDIYHNHLKDCDWSDFLTGTTYYKINYEDLIKNPYKELLGVLDFLGLEHVESSKVLKHQNWVKTERPETLDYLENLDRSLICLE